MMPLEDVHVLDLSRLVPGPFCTMLLGDLGADVLQVEPPPDSRAGRAGGICEVCRVTPRSGDIAPRPGSP